MKKIALLFGLFVTVLVKSQAPQYINYQAIARDASGNIVTTGIGIKFEILQGSSVGTLVYGETNNITPSSVGIFTTAIGSGSPVSGTFSAINWANSPYFLRVSIDPTGGTSYSTVGTSQLLSVPYALYAEKAGNTQTVNISGSGVLGSYPNYTINAPGALTPSTGISIVGGTVTNTAPDQTVTLTQAGISSVTGTYPSYTIDVPAPSLNYNTGTNVLTLTQGTAVATTTLVGAGSNTVAMTAQGIATVTPVGAGSSFTVGVPPPTFTNVGATTITGSYPNFTVNSPGASTLTPTNLQINSPHSTTTLSSNNYSINIVPTSITGSGVSGAYPNYTIASAASSSITSGSSNVSITGSAPSFTISAATPTIQINSPNTANTVSVNNYSITVPNTSLTAAGIASVSGSHPAYTVTVPGPTLSITGNSISISQGTVVSTKTIASSPWTFTSGVIVPANNVITDKVAIGQNSALSNLDVLNPAGSLNTSAPVVSITNANSGLVATGVLAVKSNTGSAAGIAIDQNSGGGDGLQINQNNVTNGGNALQINEYGTGNVAFMNLSNSTSSSKIIDATTNGVGMGVSIAVTNSLNANNALYINTNGTGPAANINKTNTGYGLYVTHTATSGTPGTFNISNAANASQALSVQTNGNGDALGTYNTNNGRALYALSSGSVEAALFSNSGTGKSIYAASSNSNDVVYIANTGNGRGINAINTGSTDLAFFTNTGTGRALVANNSSTVSETAFFSNSVNGRGLVVQNPSAVLTRAAFINGGLDIMGKTSGSTTFPLVVTNIGSTNLFNVRDDGNVGVGVPNPGYRLSVNESTASNPAIYGTQSSAAGSSAAHGIMGLTSNSNTFAAGVHGESTGAGPAISGSKLSGTGSAGRFEIVGTTNTADGLFSSTLGGGAALHAVNGPTVSGGSNAGLWLEAGHLKSTQTTAPTTNTVSASGGGISSVTLTLAAGSTDVKGVMNAVITTTGIVNNGNNCVIRVNFNKQYLTQPVVVVSPITDLLGMSYFISNTSTTSFSVTLRNSTGTNLSTPGTFSVNLNYMVIE